MNMKIDEVMMGDLVLHDGKVIRVDAVHKRKIGFHKIKDKLTWLFSGQFQPIHLTQEILKKNEFVQDANYSFRFFSPKVYKTRDIGVDFTIKGFTFWYGDTISIACGDGSRINRLPCCVHHLQHALKLCGIEKEIIV